MRRLMVVLLLTFVLTSLSSGLAAQTVDETTYYTRVGFFHLKGKLTMVNYLQGTRVPINTEVELLKKKGSSISIRIIDSDRKVTITNKKSYSGTDTDGLFERMFSHEPTDLSAYSPEQVKNIEVGNYQPGMTKDEIVMSIGYPPAHHTPTLDKNSWRFWRSKFDTVLLYFEDDVLDRIQD